MRHNRKQKANAAKSVIGTLLVLGLVLTGNYDRLHSDVERWWNNIVLSEWIPRQLLVDKTIVAVQVDEVGLPRLVNGQRSQVVRHKGYTVSYNAETKLPNWVAWTLTPERFADVASRYDKFMPDPQVADPVTTDDYRHSGYDRGHMCPAADNKWDEQAMRECFYMTNVCPQDHNLNRGDWKELEDACRDWTQMDGKLFVVAGPVIYNQEYKRIGNNRVVVPEAFYKVVFCPQPCKAIGFIYKNRAGNRQLATYANTVDEVERIVGIDFFPELPDSLEMAVEADYDMNDWPIPMR